MPETGGKMNCKLWIRSGSNISKMMDVACAGFGSPVVQVRWDMVKRENCRLEGSEAIKVQNSMCPEQDLNLHGNTVMRKTAQHVGRRHNKGLSL